MTLKMIHLASLTAALVLSATLAMANENPWAPADPASEVYLQATAHAPNYDNDAIWPHDAAETDYARQQWEPGRVLVWAHTDQPMRLEDAAAPEHWLENGEPARQGPDEHTDIIFPSGTTLHTRGVLIARHVTVQPESRVNIQTLELSGNLWIKRGANFGRHHGYFGAVNRDNFCRSDNDKIEFIANMFTHNKDEGRSTEWIGRWKVGDEVNLIAGRMVVAPHSSFMPTDRRTQRIYPDAELVLLSGSAFHLRGNYYSSVDIEVRGTIRAGTESRPLTEDCTLGLSFKSHGTGDSRGGPDDYGLVLHEEGALTVVSADPESARLVIRWHRRDNESSKDFADGEPADVAGMPHGIRMVLLGKTQLDGVVFDDVLAGGIQMSDASARRQWRHVAFGAGNFSQSEDLFVPVPDDLKLGDGGWGGGRGVEPARLEAGSE